MPVLIAMCGLPFSGKSVLAEALSRELRIRLLSYDHGIYPVHSRSAPTGSSVAAEYDFVQAIARREIGAILASGESLIYDDLLLQREDRRKLAAVAEAHWASLVFVYLDAPLPVIAERRAANSRTRARTSIPEADMRLDVSPRAAAGCRTGHLRQPGLRPSQGQRSPHGTLSPSHGTGQADRVWPRRAAFAVIRR